MMIMSKKVSSFDQSKSTLVGEPQHQPQSTKLNLASTSATTTTSPQSIMMRLNKKQPIIEPRFDPNGLVLPKKLSNPSLESKEKKEIHREMLWKLKNNGGVANQDPKQTNEYKKVYQKYQQRLREKERQESNESLSFERMLEEHKQRLNSVHTGSFDSATFVDNQHDHHHHLPQHQHHNHHQNLTHRDSSSMDPSMDSPALDSGGGVVEQESFKKIFARLKSTTTNKINMDNSLKSSPAILVHDSNNNNHNHNDKNSKLFGKTSIQASAMAATVAAAADRKG